MPAADENLRKPDRLRSEHRLKLPPVGGVHGDVALVDGDHEALENRPNGETILVCPANAAEGGEVENDSIVAARRPSAGLMIRRWRRLADRAAEGGDEAEIGEALRRLRPERGRRGSGGGGMGLLGIGDGRLGFEIAVECEGAVEERFGRGGVVFDPASHGFGVGSSGFR